MGAETTPTIAYVAGPGYYGPGCVGDRLRLRHEIRMVAHVECRRLWSAGGCGRLTVMGCRSLSSLGVEMAIVIGNFLEFACQDRSDLG
jgi:hypothetical protein